MLCEVVIVSNLACLLVLLCTMFAFRRELRQAVALGQTMYATYSNRCDGHTKLLSNLTKACEAPPPLQDAKSEECGGEARRKIKFKRASKHHAA